MSKWEVKVRKITEIKPHTNADRLEIARVDGFEWDIIVGKDIFKVGDLAVYVPIESILPETITKYLDQKVDISKGRIKAAKIRGQISYGMLLRPLPEFKEGQEVSEFWGIKKYEPPENIAGTRTQPVSKKKKNPLFREYTDVENIKYYPNSFGYEVEDGVVMEKIHGTNFRFGRLPRKADNWFTKLWVKLVGTHEFVVGSRHVQQQMFSKTWLQRRGLTGVNVYVEMSKRLKAETWCPKNTIVFGEIYGNGIQDLNYGLDTIEFCCFDVMVFEDGKERFLNYDELVEFTTRYGLTMPTILYKGPWKQDGLDFALGKTTMGKNLEQVKEGAVIRPDKERHNNAFGRTILKIINPEYLLRDKGTEFH